MRQILFVTMGKMCVSLSTKVNTIMLHTIRKSESPPPPPPPPLPLIVVDRNMNNDNSCCFIPSTELAADAAGADDNM